MRRASVWAKSGSGVILRFQHVVVALRGQPYDAVVDATKRGRMRVHTRGGHRHAADHVWFELADEGRTWVRGWEGKQQDAFRAAVLLLAHAAPSTTVFGTTTSQALAQMHATP